MAASEEHGSESILSDIDQLLRWAGIGIKDVDLFGVCVGPGSFTGLRMGIACVKGLALAAGKPVVGATSLEAVARGAASNGLVLSMIRAYRGEVYSQLFSVSASGAPVASSEPKVGMPEEAVRQAGEIENLIFAGDGAIDSIELIMKIGGNRFAGAARVGAEGPGWIAVELPAPLAEFVGSIGMERFLQGKAQGPETLRACYIRQSEAELKLAQGLLGSKIRRSAGRE
jgi:tRNA threonylcarbamoyladenosine biosynthesis protein TsaB